jgi:5'-3' exonuclease
MRYLLFDISGVLYRAYFGNKENDFNRTTDEAHHTALLSMNKFYKKFAPDEVIMACDRRSWRKDYTESEECISDKKYKGTRRQKMTPTEKEKFERFLVHVSEFESIIHKYTNIMRLACNGLEADDLIAGFIEAYADDPDNEIIIVSRDRDLAQLLGEGKNTFYRNVVQFDPNSGQEITIETAIRDLFKLKDNISLDRDLVNVDYYMFAKCIRGDHSDNVQSAYPRVRRTRIEKAWRDDFEKVNFINETWHNEDKKEFVVKDLMQEGNKLMNLREQPNSVRVKMFQTILDQMDNPGEFNYFLFLRFLGKYDMKLIAKDLEKFIPLLNC